MANICLIAVLGTGILCSQPSAKTSVSDFCQIAGPEIARLSRLTDAEIAALSRPRKEAIVTLKRQKARLCPKSGSL